MAHELPSREPHLILASSSPRRRDLLEGLGIRFQVVPSTVEEDARNGETPEAQVSRLAKAKAEDVMDQFPGIWVLGADTIVVIDERILGKPRDPQEAKSMLAMLAARTHEVYTGYALVNSHFPEKRRVRHVRSGVRIRELCEEEIEGYVMTGEPMDKAGAYAIQGIGSGIVERVDGSYTNVVGLPLCEVARDFKDLGIFDFLRVHRTP
ncbi:MAG: Maf family protein [Desulfomonilaceae bacterium]|nr:Maf family protein [Desulfomonilaceae bacterium]